MLTNKPDRKSALLLSAVIATVAWTLAIALLDYFQRGNVDLPGVITGAVVFFVVFYLVSLLFLKRKRKGNADVKKTEEDRQA